MRSPIEELNNLLRQIGDNELAAEIAMTVQAINNQDTSLNIGMLRQWLNEERIKDGARFVTNEDLEHWLKVESQDTLEGKLKQIPLVELKHIALDSDDLARWSCSTNMYVEGWVEPLVVTAETASAAVEALRDKLREEKLC